MEKIFRASAFQEWLVKFGYTSESSATSYVSYLRALCKDVTLFEQFKVSDRVNSVDSLNKLTTDIMQILVSEEFLSETKASVAYINNWKSALVRYTEFLIEDMDLLETMTEVDIESDFNQLVKEDTIFSRSDLIKVFTLRLLSQDRFYSDIAYPISFIKRLFYLKGEVNLFDNWMNDKIDAIHIYVSEDKFIYFRDISEISIENEKVFVRTKQEQYQVFASMSDGYIVPLKVNQLSAIALDHKESMFDIMNNNISNLSLIKEITKELTAKLHKPITRKKVNAQVKKQNFFERETVQGYDLKELMTELELLSSQITLQLMCKRENIKKGKR